MRAHLAALMLLLLVPAVAFSGALIVRFTTLQQDEVERRAAQLAQDLADDLDLEHERAISLLRTLRLSHALRKGDYAAFQADARAALAPDLGAVVVLDARMNELAYTGGPARAPLGAYSAAAAARQAIGSGQPVVTGLVTDPVRDIRSADVLLPVSAPAGAEAVLVLRLDLERLQRIVEGQGLGGDWAMGVSDRDGIILARTPARPLVGQQLPPQLAPDRHESRVPHVVVGLDGRPVVRVTARTQRGGWMVAAVIDKPALEAAARSTWRDLMLWGSLLLLAALASSFAYARMLERPLRTLVANVTGAPRRPVVSNVREVAEVSALLARAVESIEESERRFRTFAEQIDQVIWFDDSAPGAGRTASPAYERIWGRPAAELRASPRAWMEAVHPADRARVAAAFSDWATGAADSYDCTYRILRPDGSERWIRDRGVARREAGERPSRLSGIADDVSEDKLRERRLERYSIMLERARDIKLVLTADGTILEANRAALAAYGYTLEELVGRNMSELRAPATLAGFQAQLEAARTSRTGVLFETEHRRRDGSTFPVEASASGAEIDGQALVLSIIRDISARREAETALARYASHQELLLEIGTALIAPGNDEASLGRIVFEKLAPALVADLCLTRRVDAQSGELRLVFAAGVAGAVADAASVVAPLTAHTACGPDGMLARSLGLTAFVCHPLLDGQGRVLGSFTIGASRRASLAAADAAFLHAVSNILALAWERLAAERALRQSEFRLRRAAQSARLAYAVVDVGRRRVWLSDDHASVLGCGMPRVPEDGLAVGELWPMLRSRVAAQDLPKLRSAAKALLKGRDGARLELRLRGDDGVERWLETNWSSGGGQNNGMGRAFVTLLDISERKRNEEHVRLLLREVNHRSKNLLSVVLSLARHTAMRGPPERLVQTLSQRIAGLAASQDLLVGSDWHGVDTADLVRAQLAFVEDLIGSRITIEGPPVLLTPAAAQMIGMALHELATNAARFGALASSAGRIAVAWRIEEAGASSRFAMTWSEHGGPPVTRPGEPGLGRTIMVDMVEAALRAKVAISLASGGLVWRLDAPLDQIAGAGADAGA